MPYDDQILLLPRERYWDWLQACRKYVLAFGPNLTSDPGVAARYMAPRQVITFPHFKGAFPDIGAPIDWFERHAAGIRLDPIKVDSPEALAKALKRRVKNDDRYGAMQRPFHLMWPTDFVVVTQPFGVNPQAYRRYGMPGHEGVDFRALTNTNVYACADGEVYEVYTDAVRHAYGIHIRIRHEDGYKTVYAHLARALVRKGDRVTAGQVIGRADSTGNSSAAHLHLSLKRDGATARQETHFPKDIIDPTPFLVWPSQAHALSAKSPSFKRTRIGLNLAVGKPLDQAEVNTAVRLAAGVVMVSSGETSEGVEALRSALPGVRLVARVGDQPTEDALRPAHFVARVATEVGRLYRLGIRDFEVAAYANERRAGYGWLWRDGAAFGEWLTSVIARLRDVFPDARPGYPCLVSGGDVMGRQQDALSFFEESVAAAEAASWIGIACDVAGSNPVLNKCAADLAEKPVLLAEIDDSGCKPDPEERAIRLASFVRHLSHPGVEALLLCPEGLRDEAGESAWEALEILADASAASSVVA
jgi:hypothetical protein